MVTKTLKLRKVTMALQPAASHVTLTKNLTRFGNSSRHQCPWCGVVTSKLQSASISVVNLTNWLNNKYFDECMYINGYILLILYKLSSDFFATSILFQDSLLHLIQILVDLQPMIWFAYRAHVCRRKMISWQELFFEHIYNFGPYDNAWIFTKSHLVLTSYISGTYKRSWHLANWLCWW